MGRCRRIWSMSSGPVTSSSFAARSAATSSGRRPPTAPLLLIAGGSGVVPLRAMLRHRMAAAARVPFVSCTRHGRWADAIYREELRARRRRGGRRAVGAHPRVARGLDRASRADRRRSCCARSAWTPDERPLIYICGPNSFVEAMAARARPQGHEPSRIRTERFGPTGGEEVRWNRWTATRSPARCDVVRRGDDDRERPLPECGAESQIAELRVYMSRTGRGRALPQLRERRVRARRDPGRDAALFRSVRVAELTSLNDETPAGWQVCPQARGGDPGARARTTRAWCPRGFPIGSTRSRRSAAPAVQILEIAPADARVRTPCPRRSPRRARDPRSSCARSRIRPRP